MGTWLGVINIGQHSLWFLGRGRWSEPRGGKGKVGMLDLALEWIMTESRMAKNLSVMVLQVLWDVTPRQ